MASKEKLPHPQKQDEKRDTRFKPGQSGNPGGRPKGKSLTHRIADMLQGRSLEGLEVPKGKCVADVLAATFIKEACTGKFPYAKEVIERLDGKVPDRTIDETPDAATERERTEFVALLVTLRQRAGIAPPESDGGTAEPGRNGDGHERGALDAPSAPGTPE